MCAHIEIHWRRQNRGVYKAKGRKRAQHSSRQADIMPRSRPLNRHTIICAAPIPLYSINSAAKFVARIKSRRIKGNLAPSLFSLGFLSVGFSLSQFRRRANYPLRFTTPTARAIAIPRSSRNFHSGEVFN